MPDLPPHSYEEICDVVIDVLLERNPSVNKFSLVLERVTLHLEQRHPIPQRQVGVSDCLDKDDKALEAFLDLFRQGIITLGTGAQWNSHQPVGAGITLVSLRRFGATTLARQSPYRFHDTSSYIALIKGLMRSGAIPRRGVRDVLRGPPVVLEGHV